MGVPAVRGQRRGSRLLALALCCVLGAGGASAQSGDAFGDGSLRPPTGPRFADPAWYDLVDVRLLEGDPIRVALSLGAVDASGGLALGITQPLIEIYLDSAEGGVEMLLPGSGLAMPLGDGWQIAIRVTGDGAWAWEADGAGAVDLAAPVPVEVVLDGTTLTVLTPFARPEAAVRLYAVSGVYDPFRADGWRPLSRAPSPWAFSSEQQQVPVVDVFPGDASERAAALARGELPRDPVSGGIAPGSLVWLWLMGAGVALAIAGLALRIRPLRRATTAATMQQGAGATDDAPVRYVTVALPTATPSPAREAAPIAAIDTVGEVELIDEAELVDQVDPIDGAEPIDEAELPSTLQEDTAVVGVGVGVAVADGVGEAQSARVTTGAFPPAPLALPVPRPDTPAADEAGAGEPAPDEPAADPPTGSSETAPPSAPRRAAKRS